MNQNSRPTEHGEPGKGRKRSRKAMPADAAGIAPRDIVPVARVETAAKEAKKETAKPSPAAPPMADGLPPAVDIEQFSRNVARRGEEGGKALAAYLKPREDGGLKTDAAEDVSDAVKTLSRVAEYWLTDPQRAVEIQTSLGRAYLDLWASAVKRMAGEPAEPAAQAHPPHPRLPHPPW